MQQVKLFKGVESELETLEADVNEWIKTNNAKVLSVVGNISPQTPHTSSLGSFPVSDILIVVTHEVGDE